MSNHVVELHIIPQSRWRQVVITSAEARLPRYQQMTSVTLYSKTTFPLPQYWKSISFMGTAGKDTPSPVWNLNCYKLRHRCSVKHCGEGGATPPPQPDPQSLFQDQTTSPPPTSVTKHESFTSATLPKPKTCPLKARSPSHSKPRLQILAVCPGVI